MSEQPQTGAAASAAAAAEQGQHHAFISYARRPSDQRFVDELCDELEQRGKRIWIDRSDIPPGSDWLARITKGIESASALIFVLSPRSAASQVCQQELSIALEQNKRVIPVLHEAVDAAQLPPALARLNWIPFTGELPRDEALASLLEAIDTDLDWRDAHTRLTVRTNEWLEAGRDSSFLLRGRDLREAEAWYAAREGHPEAPTAAQVDYLLASRNAVSRRQRLTLAAVSVALAVAVGLAILALVERSNAVHQANVALSGEFATEAASDGGADIRLQALLALEAMSHAATAGARSAALEAAEEPLVATFPGAASDTVEGLAYSPNRRLLAAATSDGVELWNVRTHDLVRRLARGAWANAVAFNHSGTELAVAEGSLPPATATAPAVAVYDVATGARANALPLPEAGAVTTVAFAAGGEVGLGTYGGRAEIWNPVSGATVAAPAGARGSSVLSVSFDRSGDELAAGYAVPIPTGENGVTVVYSVGQTLVPSRRYAIKGSVIVALSFEPAGALLAAGSNGGEAYLYDTARTSSSAISTIDVGASIDAIAFNPAGTLLATGDQSGAVRLWDLSALAQPGQPIAQEGETMEDGSVVYALAFAPGGGSLCSGGTGGALFVWDATGVTPLARAIAAGGQIRELAAASDGGEIVAVGYLSGEATAWSLPSGRLIGRRVPAGPTGVVSTPDADVHATAAAVDANGREVALGLANGDVLLENPALDGDSDPLAQPAIPASAPQLYLPVDAIAFSADGRYLAAGTEYGRVMLWKLGASPSLLWAHAFTQPTAANPGIITLAFDPSGDDLVVSPETGATRVVDPSALGEPARFLDTDGTLSALAFTADGDTLIGGDEAGNIELFDAAHPTRASNAPIYPLTGRLQGDGNPIYTVAASADGELLASGDGSNQNSGTLRLWDLATKQEIGGPVPTSGALFDVAFDGERLVTGAQNGQLLIWPTLLDSSSPAAFAADLCPRLSANLTAAQWSRFAPGQAYHATCPGL